jgi:hypothetical protein
MAGDRSQGSPRIVDIRESKEQPPGVGVHGVIVDAIDVSPLGHAPTIHDQDIITQLSNHAQIMSNHDD